jgi:hypothetical protein
MKLQQSTTSTQPQTFEGVFYFEPALVAIKPNPPTPEAVKRAKFVDKTYKWASGK